MTLLSVVGRRLHKATEERIVVLWTGLVLPIPG